MGNNPSLCTPFFVAWSQWNFAVKSSTAPIYLYDQLRIDSDKQTHTVVSSPVHASVISNVSTHIKSEAYKNWTIRVDGRTTIKQLFRNFRRVEYYDMVPGCLQINNLAYNGVVSRTRESGESN